MIKAVKTYCLDKNFVPEELSLCPGTIYTYIHAYNPEKYVPESNLKAVCLKVTANQSHVSFMW